MATKLAKIVADFRTSLATKLSAGASSCSIQSATDDDGVALPAGKYFFTLDGDNSQKEHILADLSGVNLTNIKSVSRQGVQTANAVREHRAGATVTITDFAHILYLNDLLSGATALDASNPLAYDADPDLTGNNKKLATVKLVEDTAIAGGADASATVKGIAKLSVAPVSATNPIAVGVNDPKLPPVDTSTVTAGMVSALGGTSGTPGPMNPYVTNDDTATAATASKVVRRLAGGNITVVTESAGNNSTNAASTAYVDAADALTVKSLYTTVASDNLKKSADTERQFSGSSSTPELKKSIIVMETGVMRITFDLKVSNVSGHSGYGRIYKNGVAFGTQRNNNTDTNYHTYTEDLSFVKGDFVQLYIWNSTTEGGYYTYCKNFRIYYDQTLYTTDTVITD